MVVSRDHSSGNVLRLWSSVRERFGLPSDFPLTTGEHEVPKTETGKNDEGIQTLPTPDRCIVITMQRHAEAVTTSNNSTPSLMPPPPCVLTQLDLPERCIMIVMHRHGQRTNG